jgi:hypothetical protein
MASLAFTLLIFLNTYEVVANRDIPVANSMRKIEVQDVVRKVITEFDIKPDSRYLNTNSKLEALDYFEIPSLNNRVRLEESRKINNDFYQRLSLAHYIGLNKDDYGNTIDYLIYTDKSWRTIPFPENIEEGTEIKFYTQKGFMTQFVVTEKMILPFDRSFIVNKSESRQILLLIEDSQNQKYYGYSLVGKK